MATNALETLRSEAHGSISRVRNTARLWVPPSQITTVSVTGTWALAAATNVLELGTSDVGGAGELLQIPCNPEFSDFVQRGSTSPDMGVRLVGLEIFYRVATSALADIDFVIYKTTIDAEGAATAAAVTTTTSWDTAGDAGTEIDEHRAEILIAENNRFFLDSGTFVHAIMDIDDGTSSDMYIAGAVWHFERHQE